MNIEITTERSKEPEPNGRSVIAITGATGFIGRSLIDALLKREDAHVRILTRNTAHGLRPHPRLTVKFGDLAKGHNLSDFLVPGCVVINLAYDLSSTYAKNICATENLLRICRENYIKRLIHCSTSSVYGRIKSDVLNEETQCNPISSYGITKLEIERLLESGAQGSFEFTNMRPTAVFGPGGLGLKKLVDNLGSRPIFVNYLTSCLFNVRRLNLVNVNTVVAAMLFVLDRGHDVVGQTFLISEDDDLNNNFEYVENYLFREIYRKSYVLHPIRIPLFILALILRIAGRDNTNPSRIYDAGKLRKMGFLTPHPLEYSLKDFARWQVRNGDNRCN